MDLRAELESLHTASFGWALACCGRRRREAEDVLQIAYLKVLDGRARFAGAASFRTWLFGVIRRTAAESRRQQWLRTALLSRWQERGNFERTSADAQDATLDDERTRQLRGGLAQLAPRQQQVLHLVFHQDMTIEEAARVLGISLGSARTHFERGKARLRALVAKEACHAG